MRTDFQLVENAVKLAYAEMRELCAGSEGFVIPGFGVVEHRNEKNQLIEAIPFANLITTAGDQYYAQKGVTAIGVPNAAAPTAMNGMKLGTGSTTPTKSGAAAALGAYISGSNVAFDSAYPQTSAVGSDVGWYATYKTTWNAGVATNAAITEVVTVNDQGTNATSTAANTYSRAVISSVNKASGDTLAITWNHKFLGA